LLLCALAGGALSGCGLGNGAGSWLVDPSKFEGYHCNDLQTRWTEANTREKELRNLMEKASQAPGGTVIGQLTYRTDYESVLTEKRMLQQQAAEKNCTLTATYSSDTGIH
jgi:hypothetical protein